MTTLGKILAIVNLVLSLVVGAFIIMSYVARTNWHEAYNRVNDQLKVAQADATSYKEEVGEAQKVITTLNGEVAAKAKQVVDTRVEGESRLRTAQTKFDEEVKKTGSFRANDSALTAELERRIGEVGALHGQLDKRNKDLADKEKDVQTFRDRAVEMEIAAKRTQEMNERLLVQVETLSKARKADTNIAAPSAGPKVNPPSEEVKGTIKETDAQSGLVTISIGTDKGIKEGNTLDVFSLNPPSYKGSIVILNARPNEAVGRPTSKGRIPLQVGDKVASNVMSYGDQGNQRIR